MQKGSRPFSRQVEYLPVRKMAQIIERRADFRDRMKTIQSSSALASSSLVLEYQYRREG